MSPVPGLNVAALSKPLGVGVRVDVTRGGKVLALDVPAKNVVEEYNRDQTVPKQISLELPLSYVPDHPLAALNNYGHRLHVWSIAKSPDGTETSSDRGWFIVTDWDEGADSVTVTGKDLLLRLEENPLTWPSSPKKGATLYEELQRLAGDLPVQIDHSSEVDKTTKRSWEWGNSRTEAIADIAATKGLDYEVRPDGYLHFWPTKYGKDVSRTYTCKDLLLDAPRKSKDRIPNRFVAYGKGDVFWKNTTDTEVDTAGDGGHSGWKVSHSKASWTFRNADDGVRCRATWEVGTDASQLGFGVQLKKSMGKGARYEVSVRLAASRSLTVNYGWYKGDMGEINGTTTATIGTARKTLTINVGTDTVADGVRFFTTADVNNSQWVEIDTVKVTKTTKVAKRDSKNKIVKDSKGKTVKVDKTVTVLNQTFSDKKKGAWSAIDGAVKWEDTYASSSSGSGIARATMPNLREFAYATPVLHYRKKSDKEGDKQVSFQLRTSPDRNFVVRFLKADGKTFSVQNISSPTSFTTISETIPDQTAFSGIDVFPIGVFGAKGRIDVRNVKIKRTYPLTKEKSFTAAVTNYTSPYDKRGYGVVTEVVEMESVTEQQQAIAAATRALSDVLIASETRSVEMVPDPTIRGGDVHGFITESGETFMGRVTAYSLPLDDVTANMRVDVEVLQW